MGPGIGSTLVLIEAYRCKEDVAGKPAVLHELLKRLILGSQLTARADALDAWESVEQGPCTSFYTLEESHVRVGTSFIRAETWPDMPPGVYVNAEVQVCNYSRDNREVPVQLAHALASELGAARVSIMIIARGPNHPLEVVQQYSAEL